jgi:hypothetical protein
MGELCRIIRHLGSRIVLSILTEPSYFARAALRFHQSLGRGRGGDLLRQVV